MLIIELGRLLSYICRVVAQVAHHVGLNALDYALGDLGLTIQGVVEVKDEDLDFASSVWARARIARMETTGNWWQFTHLMIILKLSQAESVS